MDSRLSTYSEMIDEYNRCDTLLHIAIANDDLETIQHLIIDYGFNTETTNINGNNCIDKITFMNSDVVTYFIENGYNVSNIENFRARKFISNTELSLYLIRCGMLNVTEQIITSIVFSKNIKLLKEILIMAKNNTIQVNLNSIINYAIISKSLASVKLIIEYGGNITYNHLILACNNKANDIIEYLILEQHLLISNNELSIINFNELYNKDKALLKLAYEHINFDNDTGLFYSACHLGYTEIVDTLIKDYGYDIDAPDDNNIKPIQYAIMSGNYNHVIYLVNELNANLNVLSIYTVIKSQNINIINYFLTINNITSYSKQYILETIIDTDNVNILNYFIGRGFIVEYLPLEYIVSNNKLNIFTYIIEVYGIAKTRLEALIDIGFYGNLSAIKIIHQKYKLNDDELYKCLCILSLSDEYYNSFQYVLNNMSDNSVYNKEIDINVYIIAANHCSYNICNLIRNHRGY